MAKANKPSASSMAGRNNNGTFKKGVSGNPTGAVPNSGLNAKFRRAIADRMPEVIESMIEQDLMYTASTLTNRSENLLDMQAAVGAQESARLKLRVLDAITL